MNHTKQKNRAKLSLIFMSWQRLCASLLHYLHAHIAQITLKNEFQL